MRLQSHDDIIEDLEGIIEDLRVILVQEGDDPAILRQARVALSDWFMATYPHLYPGHGRPQLRVIKGDVMQYRTRYVADRVCARCARLVSVEVAVQDPQTIGYRCAQGHMWLAGKVTRPVVAPPVPVLVGTTGSLVAVDDDERPPWE